MGSSTTLISENFYISLKNKPLTRAAVHLESVSGNVLHIKGKTNLNLNLGHSLFVIQGANINILLEDDWLISNGVRMHFDLGC